MTITLYIIGSVALISSVSFAGVFALSLSENRLRKVLFVLVSLAIGALLGDAFLHLIPESFKSIKDPSIAAFLIIGGMLFFFILEKLLRWHRHHEELGVSDDDDVKDSKHIGRLILIGDGLHNFIDGIIIGVSYLVSIELGIATTLAIILHEIPQEIGDFGVLLHAGYRRKTALLFNFFSALGAFGGAIIVIIFGSIPEQLTNGILPFAAGVFIYIAGSDLVPELHKNVGTKLKITFYEVVGISIGVLAMYALLLFE